MNKKLLFLAIIMATFTNLVKAQAFPKKSFNVSVGYGFGNFTRTLFKTWDNNQDYKATATGPLHAKLEYMLSEKFGLGLSLNYIAVKGTYTIDYYNSNNQLVTGTEGIKFNSLSGLLRANYYWLNEDKFGLYSGLGVGYRTGNWEIFSDDPQVTNTTFPTSIPLGLEAVFGAKAMFTPNIGAYAEVGIAKSIVQLGVVFNVGGERQ